MSEDPSPEESESEEAAMSPPDRYLDANRKPVNCKFTADEDKKPAPGSMIRERVLHQVPGQASSLDCPSLIQRRVVGSMPVRNWEPYDLIDNEIRIGLHLIRMFGESGYPRELSRLIGYDIDADEPFILLLPYRGEPVEQVAGRLALPQQRKFESGVFRTIRLLEGARVVHGRLSPTTVHWDAEAETIQLVDFSCAALIGEPRRSGGQSPWSAIEQVAGTGIAAAGDDMWSAGMLTYHVTTGREVTDEAPDLSVHGAALQSVLRDVFSASAASRPDGVKLLSRLRLPDPWPAGQAPVDPRFAEGSQKYQERLEAKRPAAAKSTAENTPPDKPFKRKPRGKGWRIWPLGLALIVAALAGVVFMVGIK